MHGSLDNRIELAALTLSLETTDLDAQFKLRERHPFARLHLLKNAAESHLARYSLSCELDVRYGASEGQKLDVFPARTAGAPVFVFIHGGYFRALDKGQYRYIARRMVRSGYTTVLVNYDLAPRVPVSVIVQQVIASFEWVRENIGRWQGDPARIILCGHSVGAFLSAKVLEGDWPGGSGIRKAVLLSGLFDLGPMKRSFLNADLRLSDADVSQLNARADAVAERPSVLVAVGGAETGQFVSQSRSYSRSLNDAGVNNQFMILPRCNHYSMSRLLARRDNPVMEWILGDE